MIAASCRRASETLRGSVRLMYELYRKVQCCTTRPTRLKLDERPFRSWRASVLGRAMHHAAILVTSLGLMPPFTERSAGEPMSTIWQSDFHRMFHLFVRLHRYTGASRYVSPASEGA